MDRYFEIPYLKNGRTKEGADCYGLAYIILHEVFGKDIPELAKVIDGREVSLVIDVSRPLVDATQVETPVDGDLVLFFKGQVPAHIGVIWNKGIIHTSEFRGVVYEKLNSPYLKRFNKREYYRV